MSHFAQRFVECLADVVGRKSSMTSRSPSGEEFVEIAAWSHFRFLLPIYWVAIVLAYRLTIACHPMRYSKIYLYWRCNPEIGRCKPLERRELPRWRIYGRFLFSRTSVEDRIRLLKIRSDFERTGAY